jgi:hypothetical protein
VSVSVAEVIEASAACGWIVVAEQGTARSISEPDVHRLFEGARGFELLAAFAHWRQQCPFIFESSAWVMAHRDRGELHALVGNEWLAFRLLDPASDPFADRMRRLRAGAIG